jgi:hypothetical protein
MAKPSVYVELGRGLALASEPHGSYAVLELNSKGQVRRRRSGYRLAQALELLVELWPQHSGQPIRSLVELQRQVQDLQDALSSALSLSLPPARCASCGSFVSSRLLEQQGDRLGLCPRCLPQEDEE